MEEVGEALLKHTALKGRLGQGQEEFCFGSDSMQGLQDKTTCMGQFLDIRKMSHSVEADCGVPRTQVGAALMRWELLGSQQRRGFRRGR